MSAICEWRIANNLCGKTKHCGPSVLGMLDELISKQNQDGYVPFDVDRADHIAYLVNKEYKRVFQNPDD
jgi:hypothetical protein